MKYQALAGIVASAVLFAVLVGSVVVAAALPNWTPHGTPTATLGWGSCKFESFQLVYYENNTSDSVDLDEAGNWVKPTSDACDIKSGRMQVIQGDGTVPTWRWAYFPEPVSYPSSYTQWWDQGEGTYQKYDEAVLSYTTAGPGSPESIMAGWRVIFWEDGDITDDSLNLANKEDME